MARRNYDRMYTPQYEAKESEKELEEEIVRVAKQIEEKKEEKVVEVKKKSPFLNGTITGGRSLNVRKAPNGEIINLLHEGTKVRIIDDSNPDWYKIDSPEGYVMSKFVKIKED